MEFKESKYIKHLHHKVKTPFGYQTIEYVHKTHKLDALKFIHEFGEITVAKSHCFIIDDEEIIAETLKVGDFLETFNSKKSKILNIEHLGKVELYDISLDQEEFDNYWYYSNGVLSHNSGKSITVACYLCWLFNFFRQKPIGIVANRGAQAREFLKNTKDIYTRLPMWLTTGVTEWNKTTIANELDMRILTDVPSSDAFRGFTIACLVIDECAFIKPQAWEEFADSIFPSQGALAWKKNIIISTAKGLNHFYEIVERARASTQNAKITGEKDGTVLVEVDWREVPRYDSEGNLIDPEDFKKRIIQKYGQAYFEQNYGNNFKGSTETLFATEILESLKSARPVEEWQTSASYTDDRGTLKNALKVYELPETMRTYIMGVDSAKDGSDNFAVQILDITDFPFKQVASAQLQINYLEMPEYLYNWGAEYNSALMIIENNEGSGQSIADTLMQYYDYPNLYFDNGKEYPGFRNTKSTRPSILKLMQILGNNKKISIVDKATIAEFEKFEKINGRYEASDGHDDLVMALALTIVPLSKMDNYEDFGVFLESLKTSEVIDTTSFLTDLSSMSFADF